MGFLSSINAKTAKIAKISTKVGRDVPRQGGGGRKWWKEGADGKDDIL